MFFQFSPPVRPATNLQKKPSAEVEKPVLTLAPFTSNPKISFDNVKVGETGIEELIISNPSTRPVQVAATIIVAEEVELALSWNGASIAGSEKEVLQLSWTPKAAGAWRHILLIDGGGRLKREIPIVLKSTASDKKQKKRVPPMPRYVAKKSTSPTRTYSKKSPKRRQPVSTFANIPEIRVNFEQGKENFPPNRRDTYIIKENPLQEEPAFEDSLEKQSPNASFERKLRSDVFDWSFHTPNQDLKPGYSSTEEKSAKCSVSVARISPFVLNDTYDIQKNEVNVSSATYVKGNLSGETYTKDVSSDKESFFESPGISLSTQLRLDSLAGSGVKNAIEANLWSNSKPRRTNFLRPIHEEISLERTPVKRKGDSTFSVSPKRLNLENGVKDWSKTNTCLIDPRLCLFLESKEDHFKRWLNAILAPPTDLKCEALTPLDVAKIWKECQKKEISHVREEISSSRFHSLRESARKLYRTAAIRTVVEKLWAVIDTNKLTVRSDRNLHLDISLQSDILKVVLSYNPLWLRLGLETVFQTEIPLKSNSDVIGLTTFLSEHFIKSPLLLRRYKSIHSPHYGAAIRKHILKKFFALVYFLDQAKRHSLIAHDPCLFCKNSTIKESREAIVRFSRDTLAAMGDVTKFLRLHTYVVEHKQTYLDEFDYTVNCLGVDLRDGVRLTRVLGAILLQRDLGKKLRVPAISRLQKIHNMQVVFNSLQETGFEMVHEITPRDLVDGHKEKTLSFLWQLIYKFNTPLMEKSVTIVSKWWRSDAIMHRRQTLREMRVKREEEEIRRKRRQERKREMASVKIQRWFRNILQERRRLEFERVKKLREKKREEERAEKERRKQLEAAVVIQKWFRTIKEEQRRKEHERLQKEKEENSALVLQRWFRRRQSEKLRIKAAVTIQQWFRNIKEAKRRERACALIQRWLRKKLKEKRERLSAYVIQRFFRRIAAKKWRQRERLRREKATITVQRRWRKRLAEIEAKRRNQAAVRIQRCFKKWSLEQRRRREATAASIIVRFFRKITARKWRQKEVERRFKAAITIQRWFTEIREGRIRREAASVLIQRWFRRRQLEIEEKRRREEAAKIIQSRFRKWRDEKRRRREARSATVIVRFFRMITARKWRQKEMERRSKAAITIQRWWRKRLAEIEAKRRNQAAVRIQRCFKKWTLEQRRRREAAAATIIVRFFRKITARKWRQKETERRAKAAAAIQRWFTKIREERIRREAASVLVQRWFRRRQLEIEEKRRREEAAKIIQSRFRTWRDAKGRRREARSATIIVRFFRTITARNLRQKEMERRSKAATAIQRWFRKKIAERIQREKQAATTVQIWFREIMRRRRIKIRREQAAITLQCWFRKMRLIIKRKEEEKRREKSASVIQQWFKRKQNEAKRKMLIREAAARKIQHWFRNLLAERSEREKRHAAAVNIQRWFRQIMTERREKKKMEDKRREGAATKIQQLFKKLIVKRREERRREKAACALQKWFRRKTHEKKCKENLRKERKRQNKAANIIQIHFRLWKERKEAKLRVERAAATIQAAWKGFRVRRSQSRKLIKICDDLKTATERAVKENTLGAICNKVVLQLANEKTPVQDVIAALKYLDYVTRRCKVSLRKYQDILPSVMYRFIISTNRSYPDTELCTYAILVLINFYLFEETREKMWYPEYMEQVISVMLHFCDKDMDLFPTLITLMWLLAQIDENKAVILGTKKCREKFVQMKEKVNRKQRMVMKTASFGSFFDNSGTVNMPGLKPDWGLENLSRPRTFRNSCVGFACLWSLLGF